MPLFLLVRHAENDFVKKGRLAGCLPGVHLNENGRQQAQALVEQLKNTPVTAVYSSPLERALETAQPLAERLQLPVQPCSGLAEIDIGEWTGSSLKALRRLKAWQRVQHTPSLFRFPSGESFAECQRRICAEIEALAAQHGPKDTLLCVSHADPIKLATAYFIGLPLDNFQRLAISPASVTTLALDEHGAQLLGLNTHP